VVAAWVITLLATTLLAAGPIYSSAAAVAGLRRTLVDEPTATSVQASVYGAPAALQAMDASVQSDLRDSVAPLAAPIVRDGQLASTLRLPAGPTTAANDQAVLGFYDGLADHATLTQGSWPADGASSGPLPVAVLDTVASSLQLSIGDQIALVASSGGQSSSVPVQLVGTFAINDAADPFWGGNAQATTGVTPYGASHIYGPFLASPDGILGNSALGNVHLRWRAFPDFSGLTVDNIDGIRANVQGLPTLLKADAPAGADFKVSTSLPDALGGAQRSLLVGRTEMLLLMAQLAIMAAYAIGLTASLLVDHRRVETSLLRSRGSGAGRIAWLALAEGLLLVVPAVLVAPWLALGAVTLLRRRGRSGG
jgi:hypothetical protein